jgi:hypothetical protein
MKHTLMLILLLFTLSHLRAQDTFTIENYYKVKWVLQKNLLNSGKTNHSSFAEKRNGKRRYQECHRPRNPKILHSAGRYPVGYLK